MNNYSLDINTLRELTSDFTLTPLRQSDRRDAAVLIPLIQKDDGPHVLFQVRNGAISQGGDVSFPGGRIEGDESGEIAAVRETVEELLVDEDQVEIIAPMFQSIGPGNRHIYSYLGEIHDYEGSFAPDEVERVFTVPLSYFLSNDPKRYPVKYKPEFPEDFPFHLIAGGKDYNWTSPARNICFYEVDGVVIWGMTAEIMFEAAKRLRSEAFAD